MLFVGPYVFKRLSAVFLGLRGCPQAFNVQSAGRCAFLGATSVSLRKPAFPKQEGKRDKKRYKIVTWKLSNL